MRFSFAAVNVAAVGVAMLSTPIIAQTTAADPAPNYPNRSIRTVVPYPAGGTSDILMRLIGQKLTEKWNQQIVI
jgi:tripartite-type tricarboxylate transporter receptor subunit TctC